MNSVKKVAAIHDISGLGRCSLSVILPVLSAMGIQVCPITTTVLSAHTGFGEFVMRDLTDFMSPALEHYKKLHVEFDCIYSGFLGSEDQIDHCLEYFKTYKNALKIVDPVMGDNGQSYATYTKSLCRRMGELVAVADIITPNLTEAAILLDEKYPELPMRHDEIRSWLVRLSQKGAKIVVITSVVLSDGEIATVGYDRESGSFWKVTNDYVPKSYSGSGDMFASILAGSILNGDSLPIAMNRAASFTELSIKATYSYNTDWTDGIMFERQLPWLMSYQVLGDYESF
ncbi:MAG: pyridoxamine kinase [Ruminococcus sp.]|nr:pyridoxamine kinase [Ruminococcus sp.]